MFDKGKFQIACISDSNIEVCLESNNDFRITVSFVNECKMNSLGIIVQLFGFSVNCVSENFDFNGMFIISIRGCH